MFGLRKIKSRRTKPGSATSKPNHISYTKNMEKSGLLGFGALALNRRSPTAFFPFHCFFVCPPAVGLRRFGVHLPKPNRETSMRLKPEARISMHQKFPMASPYIYDKSGPTAPRHASASLPFSFAAGFRGSGLGLRSLWTGLRDPMFGLRCFRLSWVLRKPKEFQNDHPPESMQLYITFFLLK